MFNQTINVLESVSLSCDTAVINVFNITMTTSLNLTKIQNYKFKMYVTRFLLQEVKTTTVINNSKNKFRTKDLCFLFYKPLIPIE